MPACGVFVSFSGRLYWFLRPCLGAGILAAGAGKALDVPGFVGVVRTYELGVSDAVLWPAAAGVTLFELGLGCRIPTGPRPLMLIS